MVEMIGRRLTRQDIHPRTPHPDHLVTGKATAAGFRSSEPKQPNAQHRPRPRCLRPRFESRRRSQA